MNVAVRDGRPSRGRAVIACVTEPLPRMLTRSRRGGKLALFPCPGSAVTVSDCGGARCQAAEAAAAAAAVGGGRRRRAELSWPSPPRSSPRRSRREGPTNSLSSETRTARLGLGLTGLETRTTRLGDWNCPAGRLGRPGRAHGPAVLTDRGFRGGVCVCVCVCVCLRGGGTR